MSSLVTHMKKVENIKFLEHDKLNENFLISGILEEIDFENKDLEVRAKYMRGLIRYI